MKKDTDMDPRGDIKPRSGAGSGYGSGTGTGGGSGSSSGGTSGTGVEAVTETEMAGVRAVVMEQRWSRWRDSAKLEFKRSKEWSNHSALSRVALYAKNGVLHPVLLPDSG